MEEIEYPKALYIGDAATYPKALYIGDTINNEMVIVENEDEEAQAREHGAVDFGYAVKMMKEGKRVEHEGWNGRGMFVYHVPAASYPAQTGVAKEFFGEDAMVPYAAYLAIKNVNGTVSTWVPSVNDVLAEDWQIVE